MPEATSRMYFWPWMRDIRSSDSLSASKRSSPETPRAIDFVGQFVDAFDNLPLVLRKIAHDVRIQVERHHGDVVLRAQLLVKAHAEFSMSHPEEKSSRSVLAKHQRGDGSFGAPKPFHLLLHSIFIDARS